MQQSSTRWSLTIRRFDLSELLFPCCIYLRKGRVYCTQIHKLSNDARVYFFCPQAFVYIPSHSRVLRLIIWLVDHPFPSLARGKPADCLSQGLLHRKGIFWIDSLILVRFSVCKTLTSFQVSTKRKTYNRVNNYRQR